MKIQTNCLAKCNIVIFLFYRKNTNIEIPCSKTKQFEVFKVRYVKFWVIFLQSVDFSVTNKRKHCM